MLTQGREQFILTSLKGETSYDSGHCVESQKSHFLVAELNWAQTTGCSGLNLTKLKSKPQKAQTDLHTTSVPDKIQHSLKEFNKI